MPADTACECPAGSSGACSHILGALRLLILLKGQGFKEAPPELACTELPQQWRRPRQQGIKPASVLDVDWRSPREGGLSLPVSTRIFDTRRHNEEEAKQVAAIQGLGSKLETLSNSHFAAVLLAVQTPLKETKMGLAPAGSPMTYQQANKCHGFKTWLSRTITPGGGAICPVPKLHLFGGASEDTLCDAFTPDEHRILTVSLPMGILLFNSEFLCGSE